MKLFIPFLIVSQLLISCGGYSDTEKVQYDSEIQTLIRKNNWKMTKSDSGIYEEIKKEGDGNEIRLRDKILVEYTGYFTNGIIFDKSKKPVEFDLSSLIGGWKEVLVGKRAGCETRFICPPYMAYGRAGKDKIPENAILVFDVKVLETK